jgi:hypothetical protein
LLSYENERLDAQLKNIAWFGLMKTSAWMPSIKNSAWLGLMKTSGAPDAHSVKKKQKLAMRACISSFSPVGRRLLARR